MASFGRRPRGRAKSPAARSSDTFRRMLEEEAERERWASERVASTAAPTREPSPRAPRRQGPNPRVFFQIEIRNKFNGKLQSSGRLEFELSASSVPRTAENVRCLCTGEKGKSLHYKDSVFHRIIPGLLAQGGDITFGDGGGVDGDGHGSGRSIYGGTFPDEGFVHQHDRRGTLSMANTGPDSNNSQLMILCAAAPQFNGKNVVVGNMVKEENSILAEIEKCGSKSGRVVHLVNIVECGEVGVVTLKPRTDGRSRSRARRSRRSRSRSKHSMPWRGQRDRRGS